MPGDLGWLAGAVTGVGWVCPGEMAGTEVGMGQPGPRALCAEDALA